MIVFINGRFVPEEQATVSVFDRGFLYGDGLFETILVHHGKPFRLAQHLERMARGAETLRIPLPYVQKELRRFAAELIQQNQMNDAILRITLTRGIGERGYSPKGAESPTVVMFLHPAPPSDVENPPRWRLVTSSLRLPSTDALSTTKSLCKLAQVLARAEAESRDADEVLLLNNNGEVAEVASANLFWVFRDTVYTPPTGRGALPGVTRAIVLEVCQTLGIHTNKKIIKPDSLLTAEGVFLTLSSSGVVPVVSLDGQPLNESPIVDRVRRAYWDLVAKS